MLQAIQEEEEEEEEEEEDQMGGGLVNQLLLLLLEEIGRTNKSVVVDGTSPGPFAHGHEGRRTDLFSMTTRRGRESRCELLWTTTNLWPPPSSANSEPSTSSSPRF